ncbi:MAG: hypothetical protein ACE3JK_01285 [Sporolactobacillus sp.]
MEQQNLNTLINQIVREILTQKKLKQKAKVEPSTRLYLVQPGETFQQSEYYRQLAKLFEVVVIGENVAINGSDTSVSEAKAYVDPEALSLDEQTQVLFPFLSPSDLAKTALGIADTLETKWLAYCFQHWIKASALHEGMPYFQKEASMAYRSLFASYERIVRTFGLRIVTKQQFLQEKIPTRNEIITSGDLESLTVNGDLVLSDDAIITPLAMDEIKRRKIRTRTETEKEAR